MTVVFNMFLESSDTFPAAGFETFYQTKRGARRESAAARCGLRPVRLPSGPPAQILAVTDSQYGTVSRQYCTTRHSPSSVSSVRATH